MMAGFLNLAEAAARFAAAAVDIEAAKHAALEEACQIVEERAKGLIGHPNTSWPPLAPETLKRKDNINTPLLETGEMRDLIEHVVVDSSTATLAQTMTRRSGRNLERAGAFPREASLASPLTLKDRTLPRSRERRSSPRSAPDSLVGVSTISSKSRALPARHSTRSVRRRAMCSLLLTRRRIDDDARRVSAACSRDRR